MQPPTEPRGPSPLRGDEEDLYRRHDHELRRTVARAVYAPPELIEDACQNAWAILLRCQPRRSTVFAWLRVVAIHEAYRLCEDHFLPHLEDLGQGWETLIADIRTVDNAIERAAPCARSPRSRHGSAETSLSGSPGSPTPRSSS
jgi:DNA-directed RNA polymerase specialized sigma24 family protein